MNKIKARNTQRRLLALTLALFMALAFLVQPVGLRALAAPEAVSGFQLDPNVPVHKGEPALEDLKVVDDPVPLAPLSGGEGVMAPFGVGDPVEINILSFNDFHGTLDKTASNSNPGMDRFTAVMKKLLNDLPNPMLVAGGDNYQGSAMSNYFLGEPVSAMMKELGVKYSSAGNHDFDWGTDKFEKFSEDAGGLEFLAANIFLANSANERPDFVQPYSTWEVAGKKIGIVGWAHTSTPTLVVARNIAGLEFRGNADSWLIDEVKGWKEAEGWDAVIALTHGSLSGTRLAEVFDAIVLGHTHATQVTTVGGVPAIQANYNGRDIGRIKLVFDADNKLTVTHSTYGSSSVNGTSILSPSSTVDAGMKEKYGEYFAVVDPIFSRQVGVFGDTTMGKNGWANKVVYDYISRVVDSGEDYVLIQNSGGWRSVDFDSTSAAANKPVDLWFLNSLMPFDNEIYLFELDGQYLINLLNGRRANNGGTTTGSPVITNANKVGNDWYVTSSNTKIEAGTTYKVSMNDFMFTGGDSYGVVAGSAGGPPAGQPDYAIYTYETLILGVPLRDAMADQLSYRFFPIAGARAEEHSDIKTSVDFIISVGNLKRAKTVEITFTLTGGQLTGTTVEALTGFEVLDPIDWTQLEDGAWRGNVTLSYLGEVVTSVESIDIAKVTYAVEDYGDATITLNSVNVTQQLTVSGPFELYEARLAPASATTYVGPQEGDVEEITIFFTSDIHGAFASKNFATGANHVGMARIATVLKQQRAALTAAGKEWLTLDVGDTIQGAGSSGFINNPAYTYPVLKGFDYLGYDAEIMGNHEFNFGFDAMYQAYNGEGNNEDVAGFKGDKLVGNVFKGNFTGDANVTGEDPLMEGFKAYEVYTVSGVRVAVIGMTNPGSDTWDAIKFRTAGYYTESAIGATKRAIQEIKAGNLADVIVLAAHMSTGDSFARPGSGASSVLADAYIAANVDVFLGGHGHSRQTRTINGVKYGENTNAGGSLGIVSIKATYADGAWSVKDKAGSGVSITMQSISSSATADADYLAYMDAEIKEAERYTEEPIGELINADMVPASPLSNNMSSAYTEPTKLVDFIHDVQLYYAEAQISIACPFSTSVQHRVGNITRGSLIGIYNYDSNTVYRLDMAGWQVDKVIENVATRQYTSPSTTNDLSIRHATSYRSDSLGGVKYTMDLTKSSGNRVEITHVRNLTTGEWEEFDLNARYIVAANDYRTSSSILDESGGSNSFFTAAELQAADAPKLLQTDCNRDLPIAPDILSLMVHYISEVKGGVIDGTDFSKDWSIVPWWETTIANGVDLRAEGERFVKNGKITNVGSSTAMSANTVRTLLTTERAIEATGLVVTPGDTGASFVWYGSAANPVVQIALKSDMTNSIFPVTKAITIAGTAGDPVDGSRLYEAAAAELLPETEYIFRVSGDGLNFGTTYEFVTDEEFVPVLTANVRAGQAEYTVGQLVEYIVSLTHVTAHDIVGINYVELTFEVDGNLLAGDGITGLEGFTSRNGIAWSGLDNGIWQGKLLLEIWGDDILTQDADILRLLFAPKGTTGIANLTLTGVVAQGITADHQYVTVGTSLGIASADTNLVPVPIVYSKYDLNRDGTVNSLDFGILLFYIGRTDADADWETYWCVRDVHGEQIYTNLCDVTGDGFVDMGDLLDMLVNYN